MFLQGLIQVAAAFHHYSRANSLSTRNLLHAGLLKLDFFPEEHRGLRSNSFARQSGCGSRNSTLGKIRNTQRSRGLNPTPPDTLPSKSNCALASWRCRAAFAKSRQESRFRAHGHAVDRVGHQDAFFHVQPSPQDLQISSCPCQRRDPGRLHHWQGKQLDHHGNVIGIPTSASSVRYAVVMAIAAESSRL